MRRLVFDRQPELAAWIAIRIGSPLDDCKCIGVERDGRLIAGVGYSNWTPSVDIRMHVAAEHGEPWLSRKALQAFFYYPFIELGVRRVSSLILPSNSRSIRLSEPLGFKSEGRIREAWHTGDDLLLYGLLKRECRYLP